MRHRSVSILVLLGLLSPGHLIRSQEKSDPATAEVRATSFAPWLGVDLQHSRQTWSGTFVRDLVEGRGYPPGNLHAVRVQLRMWMADGTPVIDPASSDSARHADTVMFVLGRGAVIRGLDDGVRGMRLGGVRQLVIPSSAAFGPTGRLNVPPNAVLVAEVKLEGAAYDPVGGTR